VNKKKAAAQQPQYPQTQMTGVVMGAQQPQVVMVQPQVVQAQPVVQSQVVQAKVVMG
jgi:hypothetical protein|tara:strand:+ start:2945 stop:3115 length:171 start_codon:yes stop_codon:yes gene_type:complete